MKTQFFPFSAEVSSHKKHDTEYPVNNHSNPYSDCSHSHLHTDQITESDTECEHGENRNHHGKFNVIAGTEHIGQYKSGRPHQHGASVMYHNQNVSK